MKSAKIFKNIGALLTLKGAHQKAGRKIQEKDLGIISKAAVVSVNGRVQWVGPQDKIPKNFRKIEKLIDMQGATVLPGFIECHTHTLFAGHRAQEFEWRNQGTSYQEISARGGGILSSLRSQRAMSSQKLQGLTQERVARFVDQGVTCLEVKTGYGLNLKDELKALKVIRALDGPEVIATYLGCHAVPPEFSSSGEYVQFVIEEVLPKVKSQKIAERVDIFIEKGFFSLSDAQKYVDKAKKLGFSVVIHADQLSRSGATDFAIQVQALSADHVICINKGDIEKAAQSQTAMVLLPAADLYMKCPYPPARKLIDEGALVALATDFNPGTCPTQDMALVGLLARLEMKMTLPEVIGAYTVGAAHALARQMDQGYLLPGAQANMAGFLMDWTELFYNPGGQKTRWTIRSGKIINNSKRL